VLESAINKMKFSSLFITISFSILLGLIGPVSYLIDDSLYRVSNEYFLFAIIDLIATSLALLFFLKYKFPVNNFNYRLVNLFANARFVIIIKMMLVMCIVVLAWRFREIYQFLIEGSREDLVFDIGLSKSISFSISLAVIVIALQLSGLNLSKYFNFIPFVVFVSGSFLQLSRSEFLFLLFYSITLFSLSKKYLVITFRNIINSMLIISILIIIMLFVNIQQGRALDLLGAFENSSLAFTSYRNAAFYLGYHFSSLNYSFDNFFYPFFGFLSERLTTIFFQIDIPLSTNNSDFFYKFITFGVEQYQVGNVLYPMGPFFYYQFGYLGILIKAAFCVFLINLLIKYKFYFLCSYVSYSVLFLAHVKHPLLNSDSTYQALFFLAFDLLTRHLVGPAKFVSSQRPALI
jgi:hypothetical protein